MKKPSREVQHDWKRDTRGRHRCRHCQSWTANLPLYRYEVCPARDRREEKGDRRIALVLMAQRGVK